MVLSYDLVGGGGGVVVGGVVVGKFHVNILEAKVMSLTSFY